MWAGREPYWLLYDGDCRVCQAFARAVDALDVRGRIRVRPIQESRDLLGANVGDEILEAMHVVAPDGRVATGGGALPPLVEGLWSGPPLARILSDSHVTMAVLRAFYRTLAELRGHLVCRVEPSSVASVPSRPS